MIVQSPPPMPHEDAPELVHGIFEPPTGPVLSALARHKLMIALVAVVIAVLGAGFGYSRQRTYTASTTLQVGQVNPNSPGFYSYVSSAGALATAFSRSISAEPVLLTIKKKLDLNPLTADERLSSEPIPQSPAFRIIATGPSEAAAIDLANVTSTAVIEYETQANSSDTEAASLLKEYKELALTAAHRQAKLAEEELAQRPAKGQKTAPTQRSAATAPYKSALVAVEARLKAVGTAYSAAVTSEAPRSGLVSLLAGATSATEDRKSKVEKYGLVGLLVGILLGGALAVLRDVRRRRPALGIEEVKVQDSARA
jgi:uncharacterized protein involved in exopolysaccharide biosynthesis